MKPLKRLELVVLFGVITSLYLTLSIEFYRYFSLFMSLVKVDLVLNLFFMTTAIFFTYNSKEALKFMAIDIVFFLLILGTAFYARRALIKKKKHAFKKFAAARMTIELVKILKVVLIMMSINAAFRISEDMKNSLGNIKFSILVQEIISLSLFIPILPLA